ncbi:MAG: sigma-70 family RNA polymerase sigma factor, partial [Eubacterium sp.]|nr:sigma-70 family RNA polymerase sigma factor [Eubacterium sp.]
MDELVKKARQGDKKAFTELILLLKADLYKIAKTRIKNDEDIYDVIQETMIIAFNSIKKLKKIESFKPWIIKILINTSNSTYKKASKNKIISLEKVEAYSSLNCSDYDNVEAILDFNFILKNFKYEDRIIIILFYVEKFTDKEIGKILKLKENTVKTRRARIKEKMKNILKEGGQELYGS